MKRVVVTGMGAITPIGLNVEEYWNGLKEGKIGFGEITKFDTTDYKVHLAAEVKGFQGKDYIVTAAAYDGYGYNNLYELQKTLSVLFIVGLTLLFIVGYLLARFSLKPIRDIVQEAQTITSSQMDRRLPVKNEKDELGELSITFNALLNRLEASFHPAKIRAETYR